MSAGSSSMPGVAGPTQSGSTAVYGGVALVHGGAASVHGGSALVYGGSTSAQGSSTSMHGGLTLTLSLSQASSIDSPVVASLPTVNAPGLYRLSVSVCLLTLITAKLDVVNKADLVFAMGSLKIKLTLQWPLVWVVIQDSFDILYSLLQSTNAFPNGAVTIQLVRNALLRSALNHTPGALTIHQRLMYNPEYFRKILPLVSIINTYDWPS